ncbi:MAG: Mrp/NBP35 family ATP-binding protein [Vampirovibrionales bacterium]|nr:Mrp/NBP35 family ATP-binding protein [Vampirovibrionales bacterium]
MSVTSDAVMAALSTVNDPELHQSLTELGMIQNLIVCDGHVSFDLVLTTTACPKKDEIRESAEAAVRPLEGVKQVKATVSGKTLSARIAERQPIEGIQNIIAVSSGKGGVGKSTTAVNLACALASMGARVGILDADIYGPNVPLMMGLPREALKQAGMSDKLNAEGKHKMLPAEAHGVKVMSMAFLVKDDQPVVWRGPLLDRVIRQFLTDTDWGELDYLLIDLPPGTGDAQLTVVQATPVVGAVIVTTPQEVALLDSYKGLMMFKNAGIPILGIVENMSYFVSQSGEREDVFGHGGGANAAEKLGVPFLGEVPLMTQVRQLSDEGKPAVAFAAQTPVGQALQGIAAKVVATVCALGVQNPQPKASALPQAVAPQAAAMASA